MACDRESFTDTARTILLIFSGWYWSAMFLPFSIKTFILSVLTYIEHIAPATCVQVQWSIACRAIL